MVRPSASKIARQRLKAAAPPATATSSANKPAAARREDSSLRDIHHWVRNNLQLVLSLLNLQLSAASSPEARIALEQSIHRIRALSKAQDLFYQDLPETQIDLAKRLKDLFEFNLYTSPHSGGRLAPVEVHPVGAPVLMTLEQALPCCLAIAELLLGLEKFSDPQRAGQPLEILLRSKKVDFSISITGDQHNKPPAQAIEQLLEFRLAKCFAAQAGAELALTPVDTELCTIRGQIRSIFGN
jgi:two-component sensor histidine kinase